MSEPPVPPGSLHAIHVTPRQADWAAAGMAVVGSVTGLIYGAVASVRPPLAMDIATMPFATLPLLWRRTWPGAVLAILTCAFAISVAFRSIMPDGLGLVLGGHAAALYGGRPVRHFGGIVAVAVLAVAFSALLVAGAPQEINHLVLFAFGYGVAWMLGDRTRTWRAYLAELTERAQRLERQRDEDARRAAEQERGRIARELHDVVTHDVSIIAVQAGAARMTSRSNPGRAEEALEVIERTARGTLSELRSLLGVLRKGADAGNGPLRRPRPSLARLDELLGQARESGIEIETRIEGTARPLAAVVDLCAYRVIQESLTNVIKHAPNARVALAVRYEPDAFVVCVTDDGPGGQPPGPEGHGLIGMRERVRLAGGRLIVGPAPDGGFRVEARLPFGPLNLVTEPAPSEHCAAARQVAP
jgi:signal transduction histidine kinase